MEKNSKIKVVMIKFLLLPVYVLFVCAVMYLAGDMKDKWDQWSAWAERKFGKEGTHNCAWRGDMENKS